MLSQNEGGEGGGGKGGRGVEEEAGVFLLRIERMKGGREK